MSTTSILIAGFGGQGILFSGKFLAYDGLISDKNVSWLPSYGPEMRGGTASCSVILSEEAIGSPIVNKPNILIAMNLPSLDKYENDIVPGGYAFVDSTLIERKLKRTDVNAFYIPATQIASDEGIATLANMIIIGKMIKETGVISLDNVETLVKKVVSAKRPNLIELNLKALKLGLNY